MPSAPEPALSEDEGLAPNPRTRILAPSINLNRIGHGSLTRPFFNGWVFVFHRIMS